MWHGTGTQGAVVSRGQRQVPRSAGDFLGLRPGPRSSVPAREWYLGGSSFSLSLSPSLYASLHPSSPAHYEEQQFLSEPAVKVCSGVKIAPQFGSHLHHLSLGPRKAAGCPKRGGAPRLPALAPARLGQAGPGRDPAQRSAGRRGAVRARGAARASAPSAACPREGPPCGVEAESPGQPSFALVIFCLFVCFYNFPGFLPFPFRCFVSLFSFGASLRQVSPGCRAPPRGSPCCRRGLPVAVAVALGLPRHLRSRWLPRAELRPARRGKRGATNLPTGRCWEAGRGMWHRQESFFFPPI